MDVIWSFITIYFLYLILNGCYLEFYNDLFFIFRPPNLNFWLRPCPSAHVEWRYIPIWIPKTGTSLTSISHHRTWCHHNSRQLFFHIKSDYALVLGQPIKPSFDMKMFVLVKLSLKWQTSREFSIFQFPMNKS